jgi:tetratricopeptide (TPR) repeat protein
VKRLPLAVAACAVVVHLGALANGFALDDRYIIIANRLVRSVDGVWRAFLAPYWPPDLGGKAYRPLPIATYALDWLTASTAWFHLVNLLWHAGASVAVALLTRRLTKGNERAALVAGLLFAVHPVHVEAVANAVGRAELMAGLFTVLAVYAALARERVGWSAGALALGLLSKENAAVAPALIAGAWLLGLARPSRSVILRFAASWLVVGVAYAALRWWVLHPYGRLSAVAQVFIGSDPVAVRLTAVAAFADFARLLMFPRTLRVDYSPAERTLVTSVWDARLLLGVAAFAVWAGLLAWALRRGRRIEAFGLGWIAIAFLPVANLLFPVGVLVAERTLYVPSAGLVIAVAAALDGLAERWRAPRDVLAWRLLVGLLVGAGALRTVARVPVWRNAVSVVESILHDSPRSYRGYSGRAGLLLAARRHAQALEDYQRAAAIYDRDHAVFIAAADAAYTLGRPGLADSLLARAERACFRCVGLYRFQAAGARARGDTTAADSLLARAARLAPP